MKKAFLAATAVLIFASGIIFTACNKEEDNKNSNFKAPVALKNSTSKNGNIINIAKINEKGEIILLFSQKEIQDYFQKQNPGKELVFIEIVDESPLKNNTELEPALLFRVFDKEKNIMETTIRQNILKELGPNKELGISANEGNYYYTCVAPGGGGQSTVSCSTSDLEKCTFGCEPTAAEGCSPCWPSGKCTRSTSNVLSIPSQYQYAVCFDVFFANFLY